MKEKGVGDKLIDEFVNSILRMIYYQTADELNGLTGNRYIFMLKLLSLFLLISAIMETNIHICKSLRKLNVRFHRDGSYVIKLNNRVTK